MSRADSIRQTASIARCVSVAVTATDHIIFQPPRASRSAPPLFGTLQAHVPILWSELRRPPKGLTQVARSSPSKEMPN